jgi:hypothetical protein
MKVTQVQIKRFIKTKLSTDKNWALRALVRVYECQTANEQMSETTNENNGVGFTGADAEFLTSLAKQYQVRATLSDKQMIHVFKKMPKYWNQVAIFIGEEKLKDIVKTSLTVAE